jgi:hypothetical protein
MPTARDVLPRLGVASRRSFASAGAMAFSLSFVGASCGPSALGLMPEVVNDPHNLSLRRALLAYGMGNVCDEIRGRYMPLRLGDEEPVAGRFFPTACTAKEMPDHTLYVQIGGHGYVWTEQAQRIGFEAGAAVAYDVDFLLHGSSTYVYFRVKGTAPPTFVTKMVEQSQVAMFNRVFGAAHGQSPTDSFGGQVMAAQMARGFTVIRDASGGIEQGVGVVPPGNHPPGGFLGLDHSRPILANERIELHQNQRDFLGPFVVPPGKRLGVTLNVTGAAPAIDVLVVPRAPGDAWLAAYTHAREVTPPPVAPVFDDVVPAGGMYSRALQLPPGAYYLVLDNTATAGRTSLPTAPRDDHPVLVSAAVDLQ